MKRRQQVHEVQDPEVLEDTGGHEVTITANQIEKVNAVEGQKVEFKTSAFYAPGEQNPGFRQMRTIAEIVAAKFDCLPDDEFFARWFKREEPKLPGQKRAKKCTGCYPDKLGSKPDVRAIEVSGKAYFCDEDKIVHRLLAHFEIDINRVAVRPR